jgi:dihydrolipoamide dehydrogenase
VTAYTAIMIGSGPAGYTCAIRLAQLGARVAVVERDYVGGICTNWGCTPSKSMIESAKIARVVAEAARYGIHVPSYTINFAEVAARRDAVIRHARQEIVELLQQNGVDLYQGEGSLLAPGRVRVRGGKLDADGELMHFTGEDSEIDADHIVLGTGSSPLIPPFVDRNDPTVVSSNRLITVEHLPKTLIIVGGGVIGLEFATIFSNMGAQVTIVEFLDRVLATLDPEISAEITRLMQANGVRVLTGYEVKAVAGGKVQAVNRTTSEAIDLAAEGVLISIGRRPVVNGEEYERAGIAFTNKGITVDQYLRTNTPGIWAIGDATGKSILAHVGIQQGIICAENIMAQPGQPLRAMDYSVIPAVVYSIPEVAAVGQVPADLAGVGVFKVSFAANLRARIEAYEDGFVKIWVKDNTVIAAQALGHNVSEMIQELSNMIALRTPLNDVATIIHAHPTYSEITRARCWSWRWARRSRCTREKITSEKIVSRIPFLHVIWPAGRYRREL